MIKANEDRSEIVITQTQNWVKDFIVAHNICPFARNELEKNSIHYEIFQGLDLKQSLTELLAFCGRMDKDENIETAFFIYSSALKDFHNYLDILDVATCLLDEQGYEGIYQLASFHPEYCFEGVDTDDASHYTNRSPYPMLHLIREQSLEKALNSYPLPEQIPERNINYCQALGLEQLNAIFQSSCSKTDS